MAGNSGSCRFLLGGGGASRFTVVIAAAFGYSASMHGFHAGKVG